MKVAMLAVVACVVVGCATPYAGPDLPAAETATLEAWMEGKIAPRLYVGQVDGVTVRTGLGEVSRVVLRPGLRTVSLTLAVWGGATMFDNIRFTAQAGRAYRAEARNTTGDTWVVWIEDTATGEVVAGKKP